MEIHLGEFLLMDNQPIQGEQYKKDVEDVRSKLQNCNSNIKLLKIYKMLSSENYGILINNKFRIDISKVNSRLLRKMQEELNI